MSGMEDLRSVEDYNRHERNLHRDEFGLLWFYPTEDQKIQVRSVLAGTITDAPLGVITPAGEHFFPQGKRADIINRICSGKYYSEPFDKGRDAIINRAYDTSSRTTLFFR